MWQMTAKRRTGDVEQRSAQRERTNSRSRVTAEGKPRKGVRFQEKVAKDNVEKAKMEKVKVPVNVVGSFQLRMPQKMAEVGSMSEELELQKVVEDSSDGQISGSSKQSNRKPHA